MRFLKLTEDETTVYFNVDHIIAFAAGRNARGHVKTKVFSTDRATYVNETPEEIITMCLDQGWWHCHN